ncbi:MAG TPA: HDIG domain-containing protein, partial [Thermoanaerobaculia bacterium]|nr:HDIG domain-containing protein [Thermoanaerobaculia bacterium]
MSQPPSLQDDRPRREAGERNGKRARRNGESASGKQRAVRGRRRSGWERVVGWLRTGWARGVELPWAWAALLVVGGAWMLMPNGLSFSGPEISADSIASRDYVAPQDLLLRDDEATDQKRRRAEDAVLPVYDHNLEAVTEIDAAFARLFETGRRLVGSDLTRLRASSGWRADLAERLTETSGLAVTPEQAAVLADWAFTSDLEDRVRSLVRQTLRLGVVAAKEQLLRHRVDGVALRELPSRDEREQFDVFDFVGYPEEMRESFEAEVRGWIGLAANERRALIDLMTANVTPNLSRNDSETQRRREEAAGATAPVFNRISRGEIIVRKGDRVDAAAAQLVSEMGGERSWSKTGLPFAGMLLLMGLAAAALWEALRRERRAGHGRRRLYGESVLLLLIALVGTKLSFITASALAASFDSAPFNDERAFFYAIPYAALALVAALLHGRYPALLLAVVYSVVVARLAGDGAATIVLYSLAGSLAAVYALENDSFKQRLVLTRVGVMVGLVNVAVAVVMLAIDGGGAGAEEVALHLVLAFVGGLLVSAAVSFAVPVLESLLGIATDIKLIELANTNLPLLRRLAFEAPGTFQHSLMVANLAKEGCEAIGADATLAYTGGLYHDIGKVFRPEYFIENQRPGQNRHDKLAPSMSALILISHIKDGVQLARQHGLPPPIVDAIEQHHGTRLIKYFYNRAVERCDPDTEEVREEEYRYPGPKPQDKVMGVLMLADGIEAASRTLVEPTSVKVRTLIQAIVDDCLRDGQLDQTDLTLSDIRRVSEA